MQLLVGADAGVGGDRCIVRAAEYVIVVLAKGIADLADGGAQRTGAVVAVPYADRIEDIAEQAREGLQYHFAVDTVPTCRS